LRQLLLGERPVSPLGGLPVASRHCVLLGNGNHKSKNQSLSVLKRVYRMSGGLCFCLTMLMLDVSRSVVVRVVPCVGDYQDPMAGKEKGMTRPRCHFRIALGLSRSGPRANATLQTSTNIIISRTPRRLSLPSPQRLLHGP
jgi:hypothetical protein